MFVPLVHAHEAGLTRVGSKAEALGRLAESGCPIVEGVVLTTDGFREFARASGLTDAARSEIRRRETVRARAEEYWDSAQRIRSVCAKASWPDALATSVLAGLGPLLGAPVVLRASAAHLLDGGRGLVRMHDSFTVAGSTSEVLRAISLVWASLYSDRSLLYRAELGLDPETSAMAVIVQPHVEMYAGCIAYTRQLSDPDHVVVEAVSGPLSLLSDGIAEPHRWVFDIDTLDVVEALPPAGSPCGDTGEPCDAGMPLSAEQVASAARHALAAERVFGTPQAVELAFREQGVAVLESRPIAGLPEDERAAYLATRLPESRLERRRERINEEYLPSMWSEANALSIVDVERLSDHELIDEAARRAEAVAHWRHVYRTVLAPFAFGQRLLGEYWVRMLAPEDAFGFIDLLVRTPEEYEQRRQVLAEFGIEPPVPPRSAQVRATAETAFLSSLPEGERAHAGWLLGIARDSWRMRDDDNLYLDRILSEARRALTEIERRLSAPPGEAVSLLGPASREQLERAAGELGALGTESSPNRAAITPTDFLSRPAELLGDPAGPGIASGRARVIHTLDDAKRVGEGDVFVVEEIEPTAVAFAVRAAAIVEGRGGMFAHGAVLAREYGIPCVTGVCDASAVICDGEPITVDGNRGAVVFGA